MLTALALDASPRANAKVRLFSRLKIADLLQVPENEMARVIRDLEKDPVFKKFLGLEGSSYRIFHRQRYAGTQISGRFYDLQEDFLSSEGRFDAQGFLASRSSAIALIRSIGKTDFERYFLYQQAGASRSETAETLGITPAQVDDVFDFLLEFSVQAEFIHHSSLRTENASRPVCLGRIEGNALDGFSLACFLPHMARGKYRIDYDAWKELREREALPPEDIRRGSQIIQEVEMINLRSDNFHRAFQESLQTARAYLATGRPEKQRVLSLREASRRIGVSSSTVCRLVAGRSVILPWGEEVMLSRLFPQKKQVLCEILKNRQAEISEAGDGDVQRFLLRDYQLRVPRRTVNYWRGRLRGNAGAA